MKIAIIGSRTIDYIDVSQYIKKNCDEIISGGAQGIDQLAKEWAENNQIKLTQVLPEYNKYGRAAPIVRNKIIVDCADEVIAFWDGLSKGTNWVINYCKKIEKTCTVVRCEHVHK